MYSKVHGYATWGKQQANYSTGEYAIEVQIESMLGALIIYLSM